MTPFVVPVDNPMLGAKIYARRANPEDITDEMLNLLSMVNHLEDLDEQRRQVAYALGLIDERTFRLTHPSDTRSE